MPVIRVASILDAAAMVFWVTGRACWVPNSDPIDIEQPDEAVLAEVDRVWERIGHVPVGGRIEHEGATLRSHAGVATS